MSRVHAAFLQRTVRYHSSAVLRSSLVEIGFTIFAILFARLSAPERGHLTFRFSADDLPRLSDDFILDLLTFVERAKSGALHCRDMNEHIFSTPLRLDETVALRRVEPLYRSGRHLRNLQSLDNERGTGCAFRRNSRKSYSFNPWSIIAGSKAWMSAKDRSRDRR